MTEEELATLRLIQHLLRTEPVQVKSGEFAGQLEENVANLYLRIGHEAEAGHWFVLSARKAEAHMQDPIWILESAAQRLPDHLEVRQELKAMKRKYLGEK